MDRSTPLILHTVAYSKDAIGQEIATKSNKTVYCDLKSVTRSEWSAAGEMGHNASFVATMFAPDYAGEETCSLTIGNTAEVYSIYRTYLDMQHETIELYLEKKVGDNDG